MTFLVASRKGLWRRRGTVECWPLGGVASPGNLCQSLTSGPSAAGLAEETLPGPGHGMLRPSQPHCPAVCGDFLCWALVLLLGSTHVLATWPSGTGGFLWWVGNGASPMAWFWETHWWPFIDISLQPTNERGLCEPDSRGC